MQFVFHLLALVAGSFLTLQVGINGRLRAVLGNPLLTSCISFTVGALGLAVAWGLSLLLGSGLPAQGVRDTQWWMWVGGLLGGFYVWVSIVASPRIGVANLFSLVIAGQILLAVVFDGIGFLGNAVHPFRPLRAAGAALLVAGVYLIQKY